MLLLLASFFAVIFHCACSAWLLVVRSLLSLVVFIFALSVSVPFLFRLVEAMHVQSPPCHLIRAGKHIHDLCLIKRVTVFCNFKHEFITPNEEKATGIRLPIAPICIDDFIYNLLRKKEERGPSHYSYGFNAKSRGDHVSLRNEWRGIMLQQLNLLYIECFFNSLEFS